MTFKLFPTGAPDDPFGGNPVIVDDASLLPSGSSGPFKLAPAESFLPPTVSILEASDDAFAGLGDSPRPGLGRHTAIKLAPVAQRDDFFTSTGSPSAFSSHLAPVEKSDFFEPGEAFEAADPHTGLFRKRVQRFAKGDRVRIEKSPGRTYLVTEVRSNGTLRCEEEGLPAGTGISHITFAENLTAA